MYYKFIKTAIDITKLIKIIINIVVRYYGYLELSIGDKNSSYISKLWSLLYYFLSIKQKLSITFHPQIND